MSTLIIIGASTRAAATSARWCGWTPWCADLFADADLERIATVRKVPLETYPRGLLTAIEDAPHVPVMYTGGLENWPGLIARIDRPLWGNPPDVLRGVRSPKRWTACLQSQGLPCPAIAEKPTAAGQWLLKAKRSAGGLGIRVHAGQAFNAKTHFLQQRIDGDACSVIFLADTSGTKFLGATRQRIGTTWLNAGRFHYAGSVGPLSLSAEEAGRWRAVGFALAEEFQLRGLFGVDAIMRDGKAWPIEINPRYTASMELLERCRRQPLLPMHAAAFEKKTAALLLDTPTTIVGKAVLYARKTFAFPANGPWLDSLSDNVDLDEAEYADIPHAGEIIDQGRPALTIFAAGETVAECETKLQETALALDRRLWG